MTGRGCKSEMPSVGDKRSFCIFANRPHCYTAMNTYKVNLADKFSLFSELWSPKIVGELNEQFVKIAKVQGEFVWHKHDEEDELFLVTKGRLLIRLKDQEIELNPGEIYIVPRGVEHQTAALEETWIVMFEPKHTKHTGELKTEMTKEELAWI
jgi:mannose-6-phosphate isomerase-like protein (cupin superfamily)